MVVVVPARLLAAIAPAHQVLRPKVGGVHVRLTPALVAMATEHDAGVQRQGLVLALAVGTPVTRAT